MIISTGNTLVSGDGKFQIGAPNVSPPHNVTLISGSGNNYISDCNGVNSLIRLGSGNNTVFTSEGTVDANIVCSSGNNDIKIWSNGKTVIKVGTGNDKINVCTNTKLLIDVSENHDYELKYFNGASANVTLTNGAGNYTIRGTTGENVFDYTIPGSNLFIVSCGGEDLIRIRQPMGTPKISGDDVVIPVGRGNVIVKNGRAHTLNINGRQTVIGSYASGHTPQQVIAKFMSSLNRTKLIGIEAVDEATRKSSKFSSAEEVIDYMINDCRRINNADTFLRDCCDIIFDNADTGSITGWDSGTSNTKTKDSIVDEFGSARVFRGSSFTVNGLKVNVPPNPRGVQQNIINGLYTWWVKNALDLVEASYGLLYRFDNPRATVREINVEFVNEDTNFLATVYHTHINGKANSLLLKINMKYYSKLNIDDANGSSGTRGATFLDRTLAHEFTHATMAANIPYFCKLPGWLVEGTAELTHGIADERRADLEVLGADWRKLKAALVQTDNPYAIQIAGVYSPIYAGGFILLHYFAKKVAHMR